MALPCGIAQVRYLYPYSHPCLPLSTPAVCLAARHHKPHYMGVFMQPLGNTGEDRFDPLLLLGLANQHPPCG